MLPASAGMIPPPDHPYTRPLGAPRIRGDDPKGKPIPLWEMVCSPHPRG